MPFIDYESMRTIKDMIADSEQGQIDIDPNKYFQRYALSTSLTLAFGMKIEGNVDSEELNEITHVEREISTLRSTSNNWQDYIPLMRIWPSNSTKAVEYKERRNAYIARLLKTTKERIANGTDNSCIVGNILKDPQAKLDDSKLPCPKNQQCQS